MSERSSLRQNRAEDVAPVYATPQLLALVQNLLGLLRPIRPLTTSDSGADSGRVTWARPGLGQREVCGAHPFRGWIDRGAADAPNGSLERRGAAKSKVRIRCFGESYSKNQVTTIIIMVDLLANDEQIAQLF